VQSRIFFRLQPPEGSPTSSDRSAPFTPLVTVDDAREVDMIRHVLDTAGVAYRTDLMTGDSPRVLFSVPDDKVRLAWDTIEPYVSQSDRTPVDPEELDEEVLPVDEAPARFPWWEVQAVGSLVAFHLAVVAWMLSSFGPGQRLLDWGGLIPGRMTQEPWRLLTAMFLHVDPPHVLWNGLSMVVFAVPLLTELGRIRTTVIYLAAGIGGGLTALQFGDAGRIIVGSSGAVAGLFGAWIVTSLHRAHAEAIGWRGRVRTLGVAMLVLPSFLTPFTSAGRPVSVSSHLGGLLTGMLIGALLTVGFGLRARRDPRVDPLTPW
jgi:membrane associated rhomboid family serine protease